MTWQTTSKLFPHQEPPIAKLIHSRVGALFMEQGLGKTRVAIEFACLRQEKIGRVVWFCPVSLKETIRREIEFHTDSVPYVFDDRTTWRNLPASFWYIIGTESMASSNRVAIAARTLIDNRTFVIVDESTYIKGHNARRTRRITALSECARYRMILTGTPITQGVIDLFAQMRFLSPKILGYRSFYSFAANHLEYSDKYKGMIVRALRTDVLAAKMQPYVYQVTKDDAGVDLPPKLYDRRYFFLTEEQGYYYHQAKIEILAQMDQSDYFDAYVIFQLFTALQQIVSGFWNRNGTRIEFPHSRCGTLLNVIQGIAPAEKVIVWFKYHYSIAQARAALAAEYGDVSVAEFHGGLSEKARNDELLRWRQSGRFLLATQAAGGHGLTLNEAHYAVFYENEFKYSNRIQAEDRNHRLGQAIRPTYIDLVSDSKIDRRIMKSQAEKGDLLDDFRREVEAVKDNRRGALAKLKQMVEDL